MTTPETQKLADDAMRDIWSEWLAFYEKHFRGPGIKISAADQMAFNEIAQPKLFALAALRAPEAADNPWPNTPLHYALPQGKSFDEMRDNVRKTDLYKLGDTILVWVNEGDFWMKSPVLTERLEGIAQVASSSAPEAGEAKPVAWVSAFEAGRDAALKVLQRHFDDHQSNEHIAAALSQAFAEVNSLIAPPAPVSADAGPGMSREEIAKIIDPEIANLPKLNLFSSRFQRVYAKADAVIALLSPADVVAENDHE